MTDFEPFQTESEVLDWIEENAVWTETPTIIRRKPMISIYILLTVVTVASILAVLFR